MLASKGETPLLKTQRWSSSESPWRHWLTHRQPIFQTQTHILVQESVNNRGLALLHENEQYLWEEWNQWASADSVLLSILLHYQCSDEEKPEKHGTDFLLLSCCPWFFFLRGGWRGCLLQSWHLEPVDEQKQCVPLLRDETWFHCI